MANELLNAAIEYLELGWQPIPLCSPDHRNCASKHKATCANPGKVPLLANWHKTALSKAELQARWKLCPTANVGIVLGRASKVLGIDLDGIAGQTLWSAWSEGQEHVPTVSFTTPHGGIRYLFRHPDVAIPTRSFKASTGTEAIRVQSDGSQTVMPPSSLLINDRLVRYAWHSGRAAHEMMLAPCPAWLLDRLLGSEAPKDNSSPYCRAKEYLRACDPAVAGQGGHNQTFKLACKLIHGFKLPAHEVLQLLKEEYNPRCQPPWSNKELEHKVAEAFAKGSAPDLLNAPRRNDTPTQGKALPHEEPKEKGYKIQSAQALLALDLPPVRWVVPGCLTEGSALLAGRPKGGKSWLALQAALSVTENLPVWGSIEAPQGEALYLALEDGPRRLQARLRKLAGDEIGKGLHLATSWPTLHQGCIDLLDDWLHHHPDVTLVVIDTLTTIRDRTNARGNSYEIDYDSVSPFAKLGAAHQCCIVLVHHTRKPKDAEDEDPFDTISGTLGLAGACDTMAVLKRPLHSAEAKLFLRGRDIEDQTVQLLWEPSLSVWKTFQGHGLPPEQQRVLDALLSADRPLSPLELVEHLGKSHEACKQLCSRMQRAGLLQSSKGRYYPLATKGENVSPDDANA